MTGLGAMGARGDLVRYEVDPDGVAVVTLNRPDRSNAWNPELEQRFYAVLDELDRDERVRVGVLTGAGSAFCPGVDSRRLDAAAGAPMDLTGRTPPVFTFAFRKPLVAAVNGACAGVGLVLALMCDIRFASRSARFSTSFARRGLAGEYGITWLLPRMIGIERALDLLLSARTFEAEEALALGVVSRVVEPDQLLEAACGYARELAANCSPASMALIKYQVHADQDVELATGLRHTYRAMEFLVRGPDFREGIDSFLQRRRPKFRALPRDLDPAAVVGAPRAALDVDPMRP